MEETIQKINKENLYTGFKVLLRYLGQYKKSIFILSIMGILSAIGNGVIPYVAGKFFDSIISPSSIEIFGTIVSLYIFFLIIWSLVQLVTYTLDRKDGKLVVSEKDAWQEKHKILQNNKKSPTF
jgi:ABC-type multidrug transport system fused ATPase/permease subunit